MLRAVRPRDARRAPDVLVDLSQRSNVDRDAITERTGQLVRALSTPVDPDAAPPTPRSFEHPPVDLELVHSCDLIFDFPDPVNDSTPVTVHSPWQRNSPPPLPSKEPSREPDESS